MDNLTNLQLFILTITTPLATIAFLTWLILKNTTAFLVGFVSSGLWLYNAWGLPEVQALKWYIYPGAILLFLRAIGMCKKAI